MWRFRPTPTPDHLSNYWNALNRNAPAAEIARLAALVDPSAVAAIDRVRALHQRRRPAPDATPAPSLELLWTVEGGDGGFANPGKVAIDPNGNLWMVDNGGGQIPNDPDWLVSPPGDVQRASACGRT